MKKTKKISKTLERLRKKRDLDENRLRKRIQQRKENPFIHFVNHKSEGQGIYIFLSSSNKMLNLISPEGKNVRLSRHLFSAVLSQKWDDFILSQRASKQQINRLLKINLSASLPEDYKNKPAKLFVRKRSDNFLNKKKSMKADSPKRKRENKSRSAYMYAGRTTTFVVVQVPNRKNK